MGRNQYSYLPEYRARMAVFDFVEGFYNPHRRHSSLENHSPASYERRYDQASAVVEVTPRLKRSPRTSIPARCETHGGNRRARTGQSRHLAGGQDGALNTTG